MDGFHNLYPLISMGGYFFALINGVSTQKRQENDHKQPKSLNHRKSTIAGAGFTYYFGVHKR
jgi:hypothetical protein